MKFKYTGEDDRHLAGVGDLKPGQVFSCTHEQGVSIQKHAPEIYELVPDETPATGNKTKGKTVPADSEAAQTKS